MEWPERFQERLHIIAHGEKFDVDAFLANSTLRPDFVWRREAPLTSGVEFFLGDGRQIRVPDQEEIAVAYLKAHRDELRALGQSPGVEAFILGLVYVCPLDATGLALGPSLTLMRHVLDIGISPRYYGTAEGRRIESNPKVQNRKGSGAAS
jgi:hypothetical protein